MDDPLFSSPSSSSASDSDAYNTESARVYFGPLKTPERNFVAASKLLFLPPTESPPRRSPRLSGPRSRSVTPMDPRHALEDLEDMTDVAKLVNEADDEDEDVLDSRPDTPPNGQLIPDEPSSALAEKIIHALDNPSPPPSPPPALSMFDPYHATAPESSTDYRADLMSLNLSDNRVQGPLHIFSLSPTSAPLLPSDTAVGSPANPIDLISFDSFSPISSEALGNSTVPTVTLSVDDLLSQSPTSLGLSTPNSQLDIPLLVTEAPETDNQNAGSPMAIGDEELDSDLRPKDVLDQPILHLEGRTHGGGQETPPQVQENSLMPLPESTTTPLRRSTRPRKSTTPNTALNPLHSMPAIPATTPSSARTQVKKRFKSLEPRDEVVNDSQDDSPSPAPAVVRVRHRSPSKTPSSFQRELGSLSPTSNSVLAGLAFTSVEENGEDESEILQNQSRPSDSQPMFSFSVFAPPETAGPSTPVRTTGPVRIISPTKIISPVKFRIQTPAPNDYTNTPARRIPIAEAIAQGHISPQKAVQLGFKPVESPQATVPTPARRVLVSDTSAPSVSNFAALRYASPVKTFPYKRGLSIEDAHEVVESVKGKEKVSGLPKSSSSVVAELPHPLVSVSSTGPSKESSTPAAAHVAVVSQSSPAKAGLKQVTSRIPRIGKKPYARPAVSRAGERARGTSFRLVDHVKKPPSSSPTPDPPTSGSVIAGAAKSNGSSTLRSKANMSASTTLLKRKRETDQTSPAKPRIIMLRQVPPVPPPQAAELLQSMSTQAASLPPKGKQLPPAPARFHRLVDPKLLATSQPTPGARIPSPEAEKQLELPPMVPELQPATLEQSTLTEPGNHPHTQCDALPLGSPMKQDPGGSSQFSSERLQAIEPSNSTPAPVIIVTDESSIVESAMAGLRRTTRSRRTTNMQDGSSEIVPRSGTSRRKPSSFRSDDVFSGMSMTALKDLTTSNTVRNQKYLAAKLETEVIRKQGARPESPAVKVKTISQREQDERGKQRAERAMRRARRSDEMASSDVEGTDVSHSSAIEDMLSDDEKGNMKHRRGAGDEEDYESPDRPGFTIRSTNLFGDDDMQDIEEQPKRRVKWDRGLFTTVYLDEVKLGSRQTLKENRSLRSILAPNAKAIRLDTLGNLPHADSPLTDIIQENVTVKKIVYDSDVATADPEIIVKNTRSKGKKK